MRRLLAPLLLLLVGAATVTALRRLAASRPAGTPTTWPAVPRKPAD